MTTPNPFLIFAIFLVACFMVAGMVGEPEWIQSSRKVAHIRARPNNMDDPDEDIQSLQKLAEEGCAEAQYKLADDLWYPDTPQKNAEAIKLFTLAAKQGHVEAQFRLGTMFNNGEGVPCPDVKKAYFWFSVAAKGGHPNAPLAQDNAAKKLDENRLRSEEFNAKFCFKQIQCKQKEKHKEKTQ